MGSLQPIFIAGSDSGLVTNKKPFLLNDKAFSKLENAYVWRERIKKRECNRLLGRLRRIIDLGSLGNSVAGVWNFNIYSTLIPPITPEANAEIEPGSVIIYLNPTTATGNINGANNSTNCEVSTVAPHGLITGDQVTIAGVTGMPEINGGPYTISVVSATSFTINRNSTTWGVYTGPSGTWTQVTAANFIFYDQGDGTLETDPISGTNFGTINYLTGAVSLTHTAGVVPASINANYFPSLPVMGIANREVSSINYEQTIFFDTTYAYINIGSGDAFQEYIPGTTWTGTDSDFFWTANYRGVNAFTRLFFVTNFNLHQQSPQSYDPIRYTDGSTWTDFQPYLSRATPPDVNVDTILYQAKIIIPYFGRLLALNTWEGIETADPNGTGYLTAQNYFNRCRFSQIGDPTNATDQNTWRSDQFGRGGFIDAPTNEAIVSATFFKNTLIVFFERSTWQLRYVGEYGLPFLWERISSDYGSESKMSVVLFDEGVAAVGDKAIVSSNSLNVQRIDQQIPDLVFDFRNANEGLERVTGLRDFQRQLVFWNYCDSNLSTNSDPRIYPNNVLVYNYMNQTYAIFRENSTIFGTYQSPDGILWDNTDIEWDDNDTFWDDPDDEGLFPSVVMGNQQGFVMYYGYDTQDDPAMYITGITLTTPPVITSPNHNLESGEIIYLSGLNFLDGSGNPLSSSLNDSIFGVKRLTADTFSLTQWDTSGDPHEYNDQFTYTPSSGTYVGGGRITLLPKMMIETKDFNPYQDNGSQVKLSYIDFLTDVPGSADAAMSVNLMLNASPVVTGNIIVGNKQVEQYLPSQFYLPQSDYAWHRFFATTTGQYIKIQMTYDDDLMNTLSTHTSGWVLNAMALWVRPGSRTTF